MGRGQNSSTATSTTSTVRDSAWLPTASLRPNGLVSLLSADEATFDGWPNDRYSFLVPRTAPTKKLVYPAGSLLVLGGPPGAGKSYLADRALQPGNAVNICPDTLRMELARQRGIPGEALELLSEVFALTMDEAQEALGEGRSVVLQAPSVGERQQRACAHVAAMADTQAHLLFLDADRALCDAGQAQRDRKVTASSMDYYLDEWARTKQQLLGQKFDPDGYAAWVQQRLAQEQPAEQWRYDRHRPCGMSMMADRGYESCTVIDREAVNVLQTIAFE